MKILKSIFLLSFLLLSTISCDNNDDDDNDFASLIGTWLFVSSTTDGIQDAPEECPYIIVFNADTAIETEYYGVNCEEIDTFTSEYHLDGNELSIIDDGWEFTIEITTLNETTLTIRGDDDGELFTETYRRQ